MKTVVVNDFRLDYSEVIVSYIVNCFRNLVLGMVNHSYSVV